MNILGTQHCGKERCEAFKSRRNYYDILFQYDYAEIIVSSFAQQIQSEYYVGNSYVIIEGTELENLSTSTQTNS